MPRRSAGDEVTRAFGAAVREARQRRSETLEDVAARIDRVDAAYLGAIERGAHSVSISTAARVARGLGVPLSELVRGV